MLDQMRDRARMQAWSLRKAGTSEPGHQNNEGEETHASEAKVQQAFAALAHHVAHGLLDEAGGVVVHRFIHASALVFTAWAVDTLAQQSLNEGVEITVHDSLHIGGLLLGS